MEAIGAFPIQTGQRRSYLGGVIRFDLNRLTLSEYNNKNAMAEQTALDAVSMKELIAHCDYNDGDGDSTTQGDYDDPLERDPDLVEERFRVDRKKLEAMLQGKEALESSEPTLLPTTHMAPPSWS